MHTKEPWAQGSTLLTAETKRWTKEQWDENEARERCLVFAGGQPVAQCKRPEDASRIVAAVNACKGLTDESPVFMRGSTVRSVLNASENRRLDALAQRDDLLITLEKTLAEFESFIVHVDQGENGEGRSMADFEAEGLLGEVIPVARAAIAKARGAV